VKALPVTRALLSGNTMPWSRGTGNDRENYVQFDDFDAGTIAPTASDGYELCFKISRWLRASIDNRMGKLHYTFRPEFALLHRNCIDNIYSPKMVAIIQKTTTNKQILTKEFHLNNVSIYKIWM